MIMYIQARSAENVLKLLFSVIQLIGSTRPKFDDWPNRRGRPKLEFGSHHEKFDVWPRPYIANKTEQKI